jgi:cytochrome c oxidase subunit 2
VFRTRLWPALLAVAVSACAGDRYAQSTLHPKSDFAWLIQDLFVGTFWWAVLVFVVVEGLLLYAVIRYRARPGAPAPKHIHGHTALEIGWTIAPALILVFIAVPTVQAIFRTQGEAPEGALRVEVVGHQWWWEFRYPELGIVTANELHLPVGKPVALEMTTVDVLHSFWIPALGGKRDVINNRVNRLSFTPDSLGEYLGQCAEYCGASHANMRMRAVVESEADFQAWVAREAGGPAPLDSGSLAWQGRQIFSRQACIGCHTMKGVPVAVGKIGPDLSHVGSRRTIAAGLFPNTTENLRRWVAHAPDMKPGSLMPPMLLSDAELDALVAYLQSAK